MDAAHVHLLLNHVPVLGAVFGVLVLGYGVVRDSDDIVRAGLWTLAVVGAASVVVYLTGEPAEELVEGLPGVSEAALERHEEVALWGLWGAVLVGLAATAGLWLQRRGTMATRRLGSGVLVLALALSGLMGWTANTGGKVRHSELRAPGASGASAAAAEGPAEHDAGEAAEAGEDGEDGDD